MRFTFRAKPAKVEVSGRTESWPHESEKSNPAVAFFDEDDVHLRYQSGSSVNISSKINVRRHSGAFCFVAAR